MHRYHMFPMRYAPDHLYEVREYTGGGYRVVADYLTPAEARAWIAACTVA